MSPEEIARECSRQAGLLDSAGALKAGIDSIDVVNLFVALETELGVPLAPEVATAENFGSLGSIAALVRRLKAEPAGGR